MRLPALSHLLGPVEQIRLQVFGREANQAGRSCPFPGTQGSAFFCRVSKLSPLARSVQDLGRWRSSKTGRGPLEEGWRDNHAPIMCSYKRVQCSFEVYGFQTRTEEFIHKVREPALVSPDLMRRSRAPAFGLQEKL